ncbi:unnamed protein product [Medioppia subpectinata]|uniref:5'-deoxynucleotidase HDDC2 n=2 Tax=Medioppia subpectinata TaxID=1979941 RepID=A0A7R9Q3M0_9ACAR|nr:unnamed protein product [Medioppia subpectinata]CAG2111597.1 unnamed protein product [Medioppia subpectinata]
MQNESKSGDNSVSSEESSKLIEFLCEINKLKHLDRKGWTIQDRAINKPETVAGHMYRMAVMAMLYTPDTTDTLVDRNRLVRLTLIHDMAECLVGDITPFDGISVDEKHKLENNAMNYLVSLLPAKSSEEFKDLFDEYERQETPEAKIVKEFDRFDVMLQAFQYEQLEYETKGRVIRFQEFFDNAVGKIVSKQLVQMWDQLNENRAQFWSKVQSNGEPK